jgi:hypothetical protein
VIRSYRNLTVRFSLIQNPTCQLGARAHCSELTQCSNWILWTATEASR